MDSKSLSPDMDTLLERVSAVRPAPQLQSVNERLVIFGGDEFAAEIARRLNAPFVHLRDAAACSLRPERAIVVMERHNHSVNGALVAALRTLHTLSTEHNVPRLTLVAPYLPYSRQDKCDGTRSVGARLVADLFRSVGTHCVVCVDAHASQLALAFDPGSVRLVQLSAMRAVVVPFLRNLIGSLESGPDTRPVLVAPDAGGVRRVVAVANDLGLDIAFVAKRRDPHTSRCLPSPRVTGNVSGRPVLILDDIADSCGTLVGAAEAVRAAGATRVLAAVVVHGLFTGGAASAQALRAAGVERVITCNTCALPESFSSAIETTVLDVLALIVHAVPLSM